MVYRLSIGKSIGRIHVTQFTSHVSTTHTQGVGWVTNENISFPGYNLSLPGMTDHTELCYRPEGRDRRLDTRFSKFHGTGPPFYGTYHVDVAVHKQF
jgi:hypothetical protein